MADEVKPLKGWYIVTRSFDGASRGRLQRNPPGTWKPFVQKMTAQEAKACDVLFGKEGSHELLRRR